MAQVQCGDCKDDAGVSRGGLWAGGYWDECPTCRGAGTYNQCPRCWEDVVDEKDGELCRECREVAEWEDALNNRGVQ